VTDEQGSFALRFEEQFTAAFQKRIENTTSAESARQQGTLEVPDFTESGLTPDSAGLSANAPGVADSGTRFVARLSGLPVGAHVIATRSVASTDLGNRPGTMELRRVLGFATDFSGGTLMASGAPAELVR
jgi:hypothetical protein